MTVLGNTIVDGDCACVLSNIRKHEGREGEGRPNFTR
jgi:hypothetical protein